MWKLNKIEQSTKRLHSSIRIVPGIVKSYNNFMGGVDLSDQMTAVNKSKKQKRWYLRIFLKMVLLSIYNAYILEGFKRPQTPRGRRKRDLLSFKEDLCVQLVGNFPQQHKSTASNNRKRSADTPVPERLSNVGIHFPFKGEGKNHRCVVCERKHFSSKKANPDNPSQVQLVQCLPVHWRRRIKLLL